MSVGRPALRWHGGKWKLAPWIIAHFPPHRVYVEPFGGAASVLLRKQRSYAEIYNDLDGEVVNLFRILRNEKSACRLNELLRLTPFARDEFNAAYRSARGRIERARRLVIKSFMGFGSDGAHSPWRTGFRSDSNRSGTTPAHDWTNYADCLPALIERVRGIVVENRDALKVMQAHDSAQTLHYVDPPYLLSTRSRTKRRPRWNGNYRHELTDADHESLLGFLRTLKGYVVVSGYPSELYDRGLAGWHRAEMESFADGARPRRECLWLNAHALEHGRGPLFSSEAA